MDFTVLQQTAGRIAREHGFHDVDEHVPSTVDRKLMLIVGEIAEAQEDWRSPSRANLYYESVKPCGFGVELADAVIRIMDLAEQMHLPLEQLLVDKMAYNETRPFKHGKRF